MKNLSEELLETIINEVFRILQEMEPYQKYVHKKHPKWKNTLIGKGGIKNTAPYNIKPSMKRGKSAPPGG